MLRIPKVINGPIYEVFACTFIDGTLPFRPPRELRPKVLSLRQCAAPRHPSPLPSASSDSSPWALHSVLAYLLHLGLPERHGVEQRHDIVVSHVIHVELVYVRTNNEREFMRNFRFWMHSCHRDEYPSHGKAATYETCQLPTSMVHQPGKATWSLLAR